MEIIKIFKILKILLSTLTLLVSIEGEIGGFEEDKLIPCGISWTYLSSGDPLPSKALESQAGELFVVRIPDGESGYLLGSYSISKREAEFPFESEDSNSTGSSLRRFEILTNPHQCNLVWGDQSSSIGMRFPVHVAQDDGGIIGRAYDPSSESWISGLVNPLTLEILVVIQGDAVSLTEYEVLSSHSPGLHLQATDFVFSKDPFGGKLSSLGMDNIINNANIEISKVVRHSKIIRETTSISTTQSTTASKTHSSGFDILLVGNKKTVEHTYSKSVTTNITKTVESELLLELELMIPPFTGLTACSTVILLDDYSSSFEAKGVYQAAGMSATEILDLLKKENIQGPTIVLDDSGVEIVVVKLEGTFTGSLSLESQFVAVPYGQSCTKAQTTLFENNKKSYQNKYGI